MSVFALFFLSGLSGLAYELVFSKLLGTIFGTTAYATATVLAAFMAGLALGSAAISSRVDRLRHPLRVYAWIEFAIAVYMLAVPLLLHAVQAGYLGLNRVTPLSLPMLNLVRFLLGGALVLVPTTLMGATLPLLARHFVVTDGGGTPVVARLYGLNTFGAAAGTLLANYLFLPWTGIYGAIGAGVLANLYVGWRALRLDRSGAPAEAAAEGVTPVPAAPFPSRDRVLLFVAWGTGLIAFAYEVVWTHLLGVVVGTSAYAFGDMLLALLLGIALGSSWLARHPAPPELQFRRLALCQLGIGVAVVLTLPLWDHLPLFFKLTGYLLPGFYLREGFRLLASLAVMAVPSCLMGVSFPLVIECLGGGPGRLGRRVGSAYALNTLGAILGSAATGFFLLPALGSRVTLLGAAFVSGAIGLTLLLLRGVAPLALRRRAVAVAGGVALLGIVVLPRWNYQALLSGYNVYFVGGASHMARLLYLHEDVHGGVTSVSVRPDGETELRTNGKFQGNNRGQLQAQRAFALVPALLAHRFERAAVIGLGTGVTAGVLARFPFRRIDIAEIAPGIVAAARRHFGDVNFRVLDDPRVRLYLEDGRNMLLLDERARYDVITIELTSIWFAGAANLYSREFFRLARERLAPGGVLQQWVQLHHIDPLDVLRILNTARQSFPHVTLWHSGGQGLLIASGEPLRADYASVMRLAAGGALDQVLDSLPLHHPLALFGDLLLDEAQVDSAIAFVSKRVGARLTRALFISSDLLPWLEYSTPRGNAIVNEYGQTVKFFENYDAHRPPPIDGIPDGVERSLIYGLAAFRKGAFGNALRWLEPVAAARPEDAALAALLGELRRRAAERPL